jgi:hypothetical protein
MAVRSFYVKVEAVSCHFIIDTFQMTFHTALHQQRISKHQFVYGNLLRCEAYDRQIRAASWLLCICRSGSCTGGTTGSVEYVNHQSHIRFTNM